MRREGRKVQQWDQARAARIIRLLYNRMPGFGDWLNHWVKKREVSRMTLKTFSGPQ